jgi:tetratricopeptide (TPR) repeat protein
MANNYTNIDQWLDEYLKGSISNEQVNQGLREEQVTDIPAQIALHHTAAAFVQRFQVLQQVQEVHNRFLKNRAPVIPLPQTTENDKPAGTRAKIVRMHPVKMIMRIAAMLLLVAGSVLLYQYATSTGTKLYSDLYEPYTIIVERSDPGSELVSQLVQQYQQKNFSAVVQTFTALNSSTNREKFLTAMAYSELKQYDKAIGLLQQLLAINRETGNRLYNDDAEYYAGLAYLRMKNYKEAHRYLEAIYTDANHTYHQKIDRWTMMRLRWLR